MLDGSNPPRHKQLLYLLDVYEKLHRDKITTHWLIVAVERIANGEPERDVMKDYGYEYTYKPKGPFLLPGNESQDQPQNNTANEPLEFIEQANRARRLLVFWVALASFMVWFLVNVLGNRYH